MSNLNPEEISLLTELEHEPALIPYFFKKAKGLKWFIELKKRGYFNAEHNPGPQSSGEQGYVSIPHWPATDYLVSIAPDLRAENQLGVAKEVIAILWNVTQAAAEGEKSNFRTWWQFSMIIRHIPSDLIDVETFNRHVRYWIKDPYDRGLVATELGKEWLPELLAENKENAKSVAIALLAMLYSAEVHERDFAGDKRKEIRFATDDWHLKEITKAVAQKSGAKLGADACRIFIKQLESTLYQMGNDGWSHSWRPAIEPHDQNGYNDNDGDDTHDILIVALRECLNGFMEANSSVTKNLVSELISSTYITIKRIAIHVIDEHFTALIDLLDENLIKNSFVVKYHHEMWRLLHRNFEKVTPRQKEIILETINSIDIHSNSDGKLDPKHSAYSQAMWLAAIRTYGDDLEKLYQQAVQAVGAEPEHPDFHIFMSGVESVTHKSPISRDEILALSIDQLLEYLTSYKDQNQIDGPDKDGLTDTLKIVFTDDPLRYLDELSRFVDLDLCYVHAILDAFTNNWKNKRSLPWDKVWLRLLDFINDIILQERFWSSKNNDKINPFSANCDWVVSCIARLIESGVQSDEWAFDPRLLPQALEILRVLLSKQESAKFQENSDAVSVAINSPRGRCIEALINIALRNCRLADKNGVGHTDVWDNLEPLFVEELKRSDNYEFVTLVVMYLPNMLYMSKEWTMKHLDRLFSDENILHWRCAMQGFVYVNKVYKELYDYLRNKGHLLRALNDKSLREKVREKVIQHIAVAYLHGNEELKLEDSMISRLLERRHLDEIGQVIWFLWTLRNKGDQDSVAKILDLWSRILEIINTETSDGKLLASRLCTWIAYLDAINDSNRSLIEKIIPYAELNHNGYQMLEELARISTHQPAEAARLWKKMLIGSAPDYPLEPIKKIFTALVAVGTDGVHMAREIASEYIGRGTERPNQLLSEILGERKSV